MGFFSLTPAERQRAYRKRHPGRIKEQKRRERESQHGDKWLEPRFQSLQDFGQLVHSTAQTLHDLMELRIADRRDHPAGTITRWVMYDADSIWSRWLRDLPRADLIRLHEGEKVAFRWLSVDRPALSTESITGVRSPRVARETDRAYSRQVSLRWLRHKSFTITEIYRGKDFPMVIDDLGSWWQFKSLPEVLAAAGVADLASLAESLDARLKAVGVPVRRYFGPGPAADSMLRRFHARDVLVSPSLPCTPPETAAIYGGRIQLFQVGKFRRLYAYDLRSAYCWALSQAPSIKGFEWSRVTFAPFQDGHHFDLRNDFVRLNVMCRDSIGDPVTEAHREPVGKPSPNHVGIAAPLNPYGVYHVRWSLPNPVATSWGHGIAPLPQRIGDEIKWCYTGEGWFHSCEIAAVLESWHIANSDNAGGVNRVHGQFEDAAARINTAPRFEVLEGYEPSDTSTPKPAFPWAPLAYELRLRESLLKVPLAALWGKIAHKDGHFYSPFYAGWVTARVRAEMLRAAMLHPGAIVEIATDCIRSTAPLALRDGSGLGEWAASIETNCIHLQPGISTCDQKRRSRGVEGDYIPWDAIASQIGRRNQIDVVADVPTFIGVGEAIQFDRWGDFCTTQTLSYPLRVDCGLADPRGETPGSYQPDPLGPVAGVRRGLPWAREDVLEWL